jgi:hypothetical protein
MCVANTSAKKKNSMVKKVSVIKAKDKQAVNIIINYKDSKKVINNSKEVFSVFNNSKDKDYKKSNKDKNTINKNKRGLDVSEVNRSNNKKRLSKVNVSKSNNRKESNKNKDDNKEEGLLIIRIVILARKSKVISKRRS